MSAIVPIPKCDITIRVATMEDLPFLDALQKKHTKQLGYFPTKQFEGYIGMGAVLVAEEVTSCELLVASKERMAAQLATSNQQLATRRLGYIISRDRYLKRDELGVIYQLCVAPEAQRKLVGAALVKAVFERSAYGCRLYCCWCAQDLEANYFWESLGFVPVAFRAGSTGKKRVHIFWQKRIVEGDTDTKWWYPSQTNSGAIREDRLVFPIPPGTHWSEVKAVAVPGAQRAKLEDRSSKGARSSKARHPEPPAKTRRPDLALGGLRFGPPAPAPAPAKGGGGEKARPRREKVKVDPRLVAAARELRDRYLERINRADEAERMGVRAKYAVGRAIPEQGLVAPAPLAASRARELPALAIAPAPALPELRLAG